MKKTLVVVAAAHEETVVAVVAEAEADIGENKDNDGVVDGDGGENVGVGGGSCNGGWRWGRQPKQGLQWQGQ
jgi:hypothetical protein